MLKGAAASKAGELLSTINYLEKALVLASFVPEKVGLGENFQAKTIIKALANAAWKLGDYEKSIHCQNKVLPFAEKEEEELKSWQRRIIFWVCFIRWQKNSPKRWNI